MPNVLNHTATSTALLLLLVVALVTVVDVAGAQEYPVREGGLDTSSGTVVAPGEDLTVTGSGFAGGAQVVITIESDPITLGATVADAAGAISTSVQIPTTLTDGSHTLKATGTAAGGGLLVLAQAVDVAGGVSPGDDAGGTIGDVTDTAAVGSVSTTGGGVVGPLVAALVLLLGAITVVVVMRRRRS